ncbi:carbon-nitrogen hydrolase [Testicularia cyperi]|uniref:Carbon-nitrogen hydrolase n=1 Tax=Testicularia cyperi TaxID=1882483 RepID=A0A317XLB9_9BASI|nr:carbon-nitrogen hydrolase [Testicularia cyperi]
MDGTIDIQGSFSSEAPHPQSLIRPRHFVTTDGGKRDPLLHIAVAQVLPDESGLHVSQPNSDSESVRAGLEKLEQWASEAARQGADVVVFPEYFLSGASHDLWRRVREAQRRKLHQKQQQGQDGLNSILAVQGEEQEPQGEEKAWIEVIIDVARANDVDIVAGTVVELGVQPHGEALAGHPVNINIAARQQALQQQVDQDHIPHRLPKNKRAMLGGATHTSLPVAETDIDNGLYNTSYYISRRGEVLYRYTKQNLWHPERETLSHSQPSTHPDQHASDTTFTFQTKRGTKLRGSMAICWDLAWFSRFHQMIRPPQDGRKVSASDLDLPGQAPGPDVIFAPTCWYASDGGPKALLWNGVGEAQMLDNLCQTRAVELEAVLVMCNVAGPKLNAGEIEQLRSQLQQQDQQDQHSDLPLVGLGRSCICSPFLNTVAQVQDQSETLLLQSFDLNILRDAREVYRMRYDHAKMAE